MKKILHVGVTLLVTICCILTTTASSNEARVVSTHPPKRCICTDQYKPVCIIATGQQFPNSCHASCAGYGPNDWFDCSAI